jgi:hypothetical protein
VSAVLRSFESQGHLLTACRLAAVLDIALVMTLQPLAFIRAARWVCTTLEIEFYAQNCSTF